LRPTKDAPKDLANKVAKLITEWTNEKWHILMSQEKGEPTLEEKNDLEKEKTINQLSKNNKIQEILKMFPGAKIKEVKDKDKKNE